MAMEESLDPKHIFLFDTTYIYFCHNQSALKEYHKI